MNWHIRIGVLFSKWLKSFFKMLCLIGPILIAGYPFYSFAQPGLKFEHISLEHGLSQSIVRTIYQDSKGFLWFGTQDGLNKYDGFNFTVYKYDPFDSTSISDTDIQTIYQAPSEPEALWIGTGVGGLNRFDRETETFQRFQNIPGDPKSLSHNFVQEIYEDSHKELWVITGDNGGGLDRLDRKTGTCTRFRHVPNNPRSLSHSQVTELYEDLSGNLWIGTPRGLTKFERDTESFVRYQHDPNNPNSLSYDFVLSIFESKHEPGILWIGTGNPQNLQEGGGLNRFDVRTGSFTHYKHDPRDPHSISYDIVGPIHEDQQGNLWLGSLGLNRLDRQTGVFSHFFPNPENPDHESNGIVSIFEDSEGKLWLRSLAMDGVYRFDPTTGTFTHYRHDARDPHSLSNDAVMSIYEDNSGVLWFGTEVGGLNKLDPYAQKFTTYAPDPNNRHSLSHELVRAFSEDRSGNLWVGVAGGLNKLNRKTDTFTHYRHDPKKPNSLSNDNVWCLYHDHAGVLWVGTFGGGLNKLVPTGNENAPPTFVHYRHDPKNRNSLSNDIVRVIYESPREPGVLWIGTENGGLNRFDEKKEKFTHFQNEPGNPGSLSFNSVRAIFEDDSGSLWIGTAGGGLNKFDRDTQEFDRYQHDTNNPNSLGGDIVQVVSGDKSGILWVGTFGSGLTRFDPKTKTFTIFTEQNSDLCSNVVYGITEDEHDNLWLSTNGGISRFNPERNTFKTYDVDDGLQSREFNGQAWFKNRSGEMFFGGIRGFNMFHPDSIRDNPFVPQIALTDFKIFSESVEIGPDSPLNKHISATDQIRLAHWQNDISFEFVALHFSHPEENQYAYKLENYDEEWRKAGAQRTATYTNLDPGEYVFRVKGSNNDGVWNDEGTSIELIITPPFWETWWFRVLAALLAVGLVAAGYRRRLKTVRMKTELRAAHDAQMSIMPQADPQIEGFDISGVCIPANEVGGDFFDYIWLNEEKTKLAIAVGDVSGKAMTSAMTAVMSDGMICSKAGEGLPVHEIMTHLNRSLYGKTDRKMFTALCLAALDIQTKELSFTNAGLIEPLLKSGKSISFLKAAGRTYALGMQRESSYLEKRIQLQPTDVIIFVTDGVPEAQNHSREFYGEHRLSRLMTRLDTLTLSAGEIRQRIINDVKNFAGATHHDDITVVVLKVQGEEQARFVTEALHVAEPVPTP